MNTNCEYSCRFTKAQMMSGLYIYIYIVPLNMRNSFVREPMVRGSSYAWRSLSSSVKCSIVQVSVIRPD